jgi:hypothetical protein
MRIEKLLISTVLLAFSGIANSEVFVYYGPDNAKAQADYLAALAANATITKTITEGFEDDVAWGPSRTSSVASTTSQGLDWRSNTFNSRTGTGAALDDTYGFYSLPHGNTNDGINCAEFDGETAGFDDPCWQGDGWVITSAEGATLYGIGGWIDDSGIAKVTILLDGVNVNVDRDGEVISGWTFVGVIDAEGFASVEIRELRGTDADQKYIFGDSFTIGVSAVPVPDADGDGVPDTDDNCTLIPNGTTIPDEGGNSQLDSNGDGYGNACDADLNNDGVVNGLDVGPFVDQFGTSGPAADFNGDAVVNGLDVGPFVGMFGQAPGPSGQAP